MFLSSVEVNEFSTIFTWIYTLISRQQTRNYLLWDSTGNESFSLLMTSAEGQLCLISGFLYWAGDFPTEMAIATSSIQMLLLTYRCNGTHGESPGSVLILQSYLQGQRLDGVRMQPFLFRADGEMEAVSFNQPINQKIKAKTKLHKLLSAVSTWAS